MLRTSINYLREKPNVALDTEKTQFKNSLESFLDTFQKEYLETRLGGTSFDTSNSATQQIKAERNRASLLLSWLSEKCEQSSFNLDTCIQATAKLSDYLDEKKKELSPKTLFSHMTTFKKILTFLDFDNGKRFPKQDNLGNFKKMVCSVSKFFKTWNETARNACSQ